MKKFVFKKNICPGDPETACDFFALHTGLSKIRVKDAMNKGAAWLKTGNRKQRRIRKASLRIKAGDALELYYDENLLSLVPPPQGKCLRDLKHYSVWYKPAGLMTQGTMYGDHCSLSRQAEIFLKQRREVFLVHRLDREASGLLLLAHSKNAAAKLSQLFQNNQIVKTYQVEVLGNLSHNMPKGKIELPLDNKKAVTEFEVIEYLPEKNISLVNAVILTGRMHQIRRHFEMIGFPVMGDPKYGSGNKNTDGMKLIAKSLKFTCPFTYEEMLFDIIPHSNAERGNE
ncbi:MAG: hypothetical protein BWK80_18835 [Desulfobacteraceae bacterium IS3]|nr:MAG: hypothetical protein BWK80_18835 [Desulfobacteraceae bacterium IS3]